MSDKKDENNLISINPITDIDEAKVKRMHKRGNYFNMLDSFDTLMVKFMHDKLTKEEARRFIVYIKYFLKNGHSEALKLKCHYMHKKFIEGQGI